MKYKVTNIRWDSHPSNMDLPSEEIIDQSDLVKIPENETLFDDEESALTLFLSEKYGKFIASFDYEILN